MFLKLKDKDWFIFMVVDWVNAAEIFNYTYFNSAI